MGRDQLPARQGGDQSGLVGSRRRAREVRSGGTQIRVDSHRLEAEVQRADSAGAVAPGDDQGAAPEIRAGPGRVLRARAGRHGVAHLLRQRGEGAGRLRTLMALSLQCAEEDRTLTQLKADVFEDLILNGVTPSGLGKGIRGSVNITVPVFSLMGLNDEPAHLEGYGPIDADTARRIAAGAPSFTRLLVHPATGVVLSVGRDRYKVPNDLKRYLRLRDETCRFPGCNRSAAHSDIDHSLDWQFNGLTAEDNLAHLCPSCHALKSETGWSVKHLELGVLEWMSPSGRLVHDRAGHGHPCRGTGTAAAACTGICARSRP
ncbi:HNH endonuclease [Cryobacterium sp. TmT2-59]|nr:HNH endonuclease [Cryobacterium sp. TmT2-59]